MAQRINLTFHPWSIYIPGFPPSPDRLAQNKLLNYLYKLNVRVRR